MPPTKRMSMEEKRKAILAVYHGEKQVYTEKEIITLATKAGVNANTIADVNTALVDDGLVEKEKIGGSNYFWSFPSKKDHMAQIQHENNLEQVELLTKQVEEARNQLTVAKRGREDDEDEEEADAGAGGAGEDGSGEEKKAAATAADGAEEKKQERRPQKLARLATIKTQQVALQKELDQLKENDPQVLADLAKCLDLTQQAANRWTDNIFNIKSYLVKKCSMDNKRACQFLGISSEFDYPEDKIPK